MQPLLLAFNSTLAFVLGIPSYIPVLLLVAAGILFVRFPFLTGILILPYRLVAAIARLLGLSGKNHTWSVVYDSRTKLPLDPAYVTVRDPLGVEVASMITDINGRFSLILPRGTYSIDVQKTHYAFPSFELRKARNDGKYTSLYYGEQFSVVDTEQPVVLSIPMDATGEDWNEQEKKDRKLFSRFTQNSGITASQYLYLAVGLVLVSTHFIAYRDVFSMNLAFGYFGLIILSMLSYLVRPSKYPHSVVVDKRTGMPLGFARVTMYSAKTKSKIMQKITSFEGQFTALLPKGTYYLAIEGRDSTGNYSLLHTTSEFHLSSGYLGRKFSV